MTKLPTCSTCSGFVPHDAEACPHCDAPGQRRARFATLRRIGRGVLSTAVGGSIAMTLMACYGGPPAGWQPPGTPENDCSATNDADKDGFCGAADCDDSNPAIHERCGEPVPAPSGTPVADP